MSNRACWLYEGGRGGGCAPPAPDDGAFLVARALQAVLRDIPNPTSSLLATRAPARALVLKYRPATVVSQAIWARLVQCHFDAAYGRAMAVLRR